MQVAASKIRYKGRRTEQQDTVNVFEVQTPEGDSCAVGVLTDGVGGLERGGEASAIVNAEVSEGIRAGCAAGWRDARICDEVAAVARKANVALRRHMDSRGIARCGTTLLAVVLSGGRLHFVSIGDSPLFALTREGRLVRLNDEHVANVNGRVALRSAVTGEEIAEIDRGAIELESAGYSHVLLSSDGIRSMPVADLVACLNSDRPCKLRDIVIRVMEIDSSSQDNLSLVLFELGR